MPRKKNPSAMKVAGLVLLGAAGVGALVAVPAVLVARHMRKMKDDADAAFDEEIITEPDRPIPPIPPIGSVGDGGSEVDVGADDGVPLVAPEKLVGFARGLDGKPQPGPSTPPGIYFVHEDDFVFVPGEDGAQLQWVMEKVEVEAAAAQQGDPVSSNTVGLTTEFFDRFWPEITMPPAADGPERVVHLYQAIAFTLTDLIVLAGGRVLGTDNMEDALTVLAAKLTGMGYPDFDPSVVPEVDPFSGDDPEGPGEGTLPKSPFTAGIGELKLG